MSKPKRQMSEVSTEYQNTCLKAGHVQYQIQTLKNDLAIINTKLQDLNLEAAEIKSAEAAEKAKQGGES